VTKCIVVGGGICGIFSAILLSDKFSEVYVIEKDEKCGGLLKSVSDDAGNLFDQGTHIPNKTMVSEIDAILFGDESTRHEHWKDLGRLRTGNYFSGQWNNIHQMVDLRVLPKQVYQQSVMELLERTKESNAKDIVTYLIETLGPTITTEVVTPIAKKLYGNDVDLSQLVQNSSVSYFGLSRVLALTAEVTKKLKEISAFDNKLTYHNQQDFEERIQQDNIAQTTSYYPKNGQGVGFWIEQLINQAKVKGVKFLNNEYITRINHQEKQIQSVELGTANKTLKCDFVFWTAPPVLALKAANIAVKKRQLSFRSACIFHFMLDKPLLNDSAYYLWNWDAKCKGFRITLYPNMQTGKEAGQYKVTTEVLCKPEEAENIELADIFQELIDIEIIDKNSNIVSQLKQVIHQTFPVPTFEFNDAVKSNYNSLVAAFDNIHIAGRFAGKSWFHQDVLTDAYNDIHRLFPE
jgi:protoporphyrinogen oxidase